MTTGATPSPPHKWGCGGGKSVVEFSIQKERKMLKIGDRVCAGGRNDTIARGVVVDIIPANEYRQAMYRIRFDSTGKDIVTLTPNPSESWVDEGMVYGPFDQNTGVTNMAPELLAILANVKEYCEDQAIYDKLGRYGDFYYKIVEILKKEKV